MSSFKEQLSEQTLLLLWSLWTELGVAGLYRNHAHCLVDPETLLLLTAWLGEADPRLQEEVFDDWCGRYGELLSLQRIHGLAKLMNYLDFKNALDVIAQSLGKPGGQLHQKARKSRLPPLTQPSLLMLHLAAVFGVGSRAVTLATLLVEPNGLSASDIASVCGYSKRNVANTLEALHLGGLLGKVEVKNRLRYYLIATNQLKALIGPLPDNLTGWLFVFSFVALWMQYAQQSDGATPLRRAVSSIKLVKQMHSVLTIAGCAPPLLAGQPGEDVERIEAWVLQTIADIAKGTSALLKYSFLLPALSGSAVVPTSS